MDGHALVLGIEAGAFGDSPGEQDPIELEAEVVMEVGGGVLLDDEAQVFTTCSPLPAGLQSDAEVAPRPVPGQWVVHVVSCCVRGFDAFGA